MTTDATLKYNGQRFQRIEPGLFRCIDEPGRYLIRYYPHGRNGPCVRRTIRTIGGYKLADLKADLETKRREIQARRTGIGSHTTAHTALTDYLSHLQRLDRSPRHQHDIQVALTRFLDHHDLRHLDQITVPLIDKHLQTLAATGLSPRSINKHRGFISAWLTWAIKRGHLQRNPVLHVDKTAETRRLKPFPSPEQFKQLLSASRCRYDAGIWTLLTHTGLRISSLLALERADFQPNGILVRKTKRNREWLLDYDDGCPLWSPHLSLLGRRLWDHRTPTPSYCVSRLAKACATLGTRFTMHSFRHAFCSWLAMMGESLHDIRDWAHHTSITTTEEYYAHLRPHGQARAAENHETVVIISSYALTALAGDLAQPLPRNENQDTGP